MIGLRRILFALIGCLLRSLARAPLGCGAMLIRLAAGCERRSRPALESRGGR